MSQQTRRPSHLSAAQNNPHVLPFLPPAPDPGRPLSNPGAQVESWGGRADEGQAAGAGRGGRGLPLVGGGLPGPGQPCAPHRLVPQRAVLIDAAHSPHAAAQKTRGTARGRARRTRRDPRFPATDQGRARPARAFPTGLKAPIPIPARGTRARGGRGFPGRPAAGALEHPSLFSLFLVTKGRPLPQHTHKGETEAQRAYRTSSERMGFH